MENLDQEEKHLTIEEIKHCEKASNICHKTGIISAFVTGFLFLGSCVNVGICESQNTSIWGKMVEYLLCILLMKLGYSTCEMSRNAFVESEKMNNMIKEEKEYYRSQK